MSVIGTFYNETMDVKKQATVTGSETTGFTSVASGISCVIMPVGEMDRLYERSNIGKEFEIYCTADTEIKTGYIATIDSNDYGVIGISEYTDHFQGTDGYYLIRGVKK